MTFKQHYQKFISQNPDTLHCAPHSHHYWPDVTFEAQQAYWHDSAKGVDHKWDIIFGERVPAVQQHLARLLKHPHSEQFVFAGNTHELVYRLLSCFDPQQPLRILTTDSEFHSFSRQVRRLSERKNVTIEVVQTEPFADFSNRWSDAVSAADYDLIFASQVFFNSGVVAPWVGDWLEQVPVHTQVVIDGYHGCGAIPTDLSTVADRVFYLAGGYKYLQAGEGCCFMAVPKGCQLRPEYTGWFADFENLAAPQQDQVGYASDGMRFAGATMDFTALYRLQAVFDWWQRDGLSVAGMHDYIQGLQKAFMQVIDSCQHPLINRDHLIAVDRKDPTYRQGHFLTFRLPTEAHVTELAEQLQKQGVATDYRGNRLRFGFAIYHEPADYQRIKKALEQA